MPSTILCFNLFFRVVMLLFIYFVLSFSVPSVGGSGWSGLTPPYQNWIFLPPFCLSVDMSVRPNQKIRTAPIFSNTRTLNISGLVSQVMQVLKGLRGDRKSAQRLTKLKAATSTWAGKTMERDVTRAQLSGQELKHQRLHCWDTVGVVS